MQIRAPFGALPQEEILAETANDLIGTADCLNRIARALRELSFELEAACNDLLANAVELDTIRDKDEWRLRGSNGNCGA